MKQEFVIGFHSFHKDEGLNFQLNRFYSFGAISYSEMLEISNKITDFKSWIDVFLETAQSAEKDGNTEKCAVCYRAAQFYAIGNQENTEGMLLKNYLYQKCLEAYSKAYSGIEYLRYERVPFLTGYLPVYCLKHKEKAKGTIVIHGGYDSIMQEFLGYAIYFYQAGYDVYFFEGPGQGEVLYRCNIKMTHEWEHCVKAILDYYSLTDVTLIGISLGGYLAVRAAAYEVRIKRLIMFDLIYDFYGSIKARLGKLGGKLLDHLMEHSGSPIWSIVEKGAKHIFFLKWLFEQGFNIFENVSTPYEYFNCIKKYNTRDISALIRQDTLVLAGESDLYTIYFEKQIEALKNARSVESRLFTKEENADQHCQIGNTKLALDCMINWIERKQNNGKKSCN